MITFKTFLAEEEARKIYAEKIEGAPEWSPSVAEENYRIGPITFSAGKGLGSTPVNRNIWHEGAVVFMKPSTFLKLALDDQGAQEPTSFELEDLVVKQGYAVGIPFLDIRIDEKGESLPKVTGHEGRGRMRMIRRVLGDEPIPVHLKLAGGYRSDYLYKNPEIIDEIKQGLHAQGGGLVRRPITKIFVSAEGRYNTPGKEL